MRPLTDLDDAHAMAEVGRRSTLMRARKEALEALRDALTEANAVDDMDALDKPAKKAIEAAERLVEIAGIWRCI